jgi:hypothetical protein
MTRGSMKLYTRSKVCIAVAAGLLSVAGLPSVLAAQAGDFAVDDADAQARQAWRETMHQASTPDTGCFHASYPSTQWERVECDEAPGYRSALPDITGREQTVGNGLDYVAQAPSGHLFSLAVGSFPTVTGVTGERGVNVPFGGGESEGIIGRNEYTLQVNTNFEQNTAACNGFTECFAWQQYALSTNYNGGPRGKTEVFIEYWLLNYGVDDGEDICPKGFIDIGPSGAGGDDCVQNSPATVVFDGQIPITDLANLQLSGSAVANGRDKATVTYDTEAFSATVVDSLTDVSSAWTEVEFNVFGNGGGSRADFKSGSSVTVNLAVTDGSTSKPTCEPPSKFDGTTGETNNLRLGACTATGGSTPSIEFTESN